MYKKNQLVAARESHNKPWKLMIFVKDYQDNQYIIKNPEDGAEFLIFKHNVVPAEDIWKDIFLAKREKEEICLIKSLKSLIYAIGGTWTAEWVDEVVQASKLGEVKKFG